MTTTTIRKHYSNGVMREKITLVNEKLHGEYICYAQNGCIIEKSNWYEGKRDGECILYYDNEDYSHIIYEKSQWQNGNMISEDKTIIDGLKPPTRIE
jgi:antitoxin component YwqK of YwqJK toxin-antitoxin module